MLRKRVWIPIVSVFVIAMGCGLFYGRKVANQEPVKVYKPVEVSEKPATPKPPPPGETYETGHWHGDEWHSEPHEVHAPVEVSEVEVSERAEVPGASVGAPPINAQTIEQAVQDGKVELFSERTPEYHEAVEKWQAWHKKFDELHDEYSQANWEHIATMPGTEAEAKRYDTDENYRREVQRKMSEALDKCWEVAIKMRDHEAKRPPVPYIP